MAKIADRYFINKPWDIKEEGFQSSYSQVSESIFSLGNEYMGIRGIFEEGYSGEKLIGSYVNGIYEVKKYSEKGYRGEADSTEYMVNAVNWIDMVIKAEDEQLDLFTSEVSAFERNLDLKTGKLTRSFVWHTKNGKHIQLYFERFLSMQQVEYGVQYVQIDSMDFEGTIYISAMLDFSEVHESSGTNLWSCNEHKAEPTYYQIEGTTTTTGQKIFSSCKIKTNMNPTNEIIKEKEVGYQYELRVTGGDRIAFSRLAQIQSCKTMGAVKGNWDLGLHRVGVPEKRKELEEENLSFWNHVWNQSDIVIEGDELNQQGIRFCIFQMYQTYQGAAQGTNIGAKGLTGEAYNGNAFWDTETYCLPFYIFNNKKAAKSLLEFRYRTLKQAKARAKDLDCEGAFYPVATISGEECCNLWQHASLQLQASTAVAYGLWFYEKLTGDHSLMEEFGLEILIEVSRMLRTRGAYSADGEGFGFFGVMGPDEFQMMVSHNCYTNYMGRFTLAYTVQEIARIREMNPEIIHAIERKVKLKEEEVHAWEKIASDMFIPLHKESGIYEQHKGFFALPHIDVDKIPVKEFPLYSHWTYDRIYRNDMIKQPDVLMLMLLFNSEFSDEEILKNYEFYEPKCIHESSLSPSVHSILANQIGKEQEAYQFFQFATRLDLDNYNRNTKEGLHTTSIAAAWMNIVYGFGGLRSDGEILKFAPTIPIGWKRYQFRLTIGETLLQVSVDSQGAEFKTLEGQTIKINIYDKEYEIDGQGIWVSKN